MRDPDLLRQALGETANERLQHMQGLFPGANVRLQGQPDPTGLSEFVEWLRGGAFDVW